MSLKRTQNNKYFLLESENVLAGKDAVSSTLKGSLVLRDFGAPQKDTERTSERYWKGYLVTLSQYFICWRDNIITVQTGTTRYVQPFKKFNSNGYYFQYSSNSKSPSRHRIFMNCANFPMGILPEFCYNGARSINLSI